MSAETGAAPLGWAVVDKDGSLGLAGWCFSSIKTVATVMAESLNSERQGGGLLERDREFEARLARRPFRVVPVGEVPAWQPIETAPMDESIIRVASAGGLTGEARWDGGGWASSTWRNCTFMAPEFWQPLPAAPGVEAFDRGFKAAEKEGLR